MTKLPGKPSHRGSWIQTEREAHEAWAELMYKNPNAARLMHLLVARIGENNAVVASLNTLAKLLRVKTRNTVISAVKVLEEGRWIEVIRTGGSGTTNAYVVNDRVAWVGNRDGIRFSLFSATVIASADEQPDAEHLDTRLPLRRLPRIGEMQFPHGDGLPPPSQPFLDGLEPDIPASS